MPRAPKLSPSSKPTPEQELRRLKIKPAPSKARCWCRCGHGPCAAWSEHPLGRPVSAEVFNGHLLNEVAAAVNVDWGKGYSDGRMVARAEREMRPPGMYLVALGGPCSAGSGCYVSIETMGKLGWEGYCEMHKGKAMQAMCLAGSESAVPPFGLVLSWRPEHGPVDWDLLYKVVDEAPAAGTPPPRQQQPTPAPEPAIPSTSPQPLLAASNITPRSPPSPVHQRQSSTTPTPMPASTKKRARPAPRLSDEAQRDMDAYDRGRRAARAAHKRELMARDKVNEEARVLEEAHRAQEEAEQAAEREARARQGLADLRAAVAAVADDGLSATSELKMMTGRLRDVTERLEREEERIADEEARGRSREGGVEPAEVGGSQEKPAVA